MSCRGLVARVASIWIKSNLVPIVRQIASILKNFGNRLSLFWRTDKEVLARSGNFVDEFALGVQIALDNLFRSV